MFISRGSHNALCHLRQELRKFSQGKRKFFTKFSFSQGKRNLKHKSFI